MNYNNSEDWRKKEKEIFANPEIADISALPAVEYKYFDLFREISVEYKSKLISEEEFRDKLKLIRKDYNQSVEERKRIRLMHVQYQYNIKQADQLKIEAEKSGDLYRIACCTADIVGLLTGDEGYGKRIRAKIKTFYD